jgi:hypothetical protein
MEVVMMVVVVIIIIIQFLYLSAFQQQVAY